MTTGNLLELLVGLDRTGELEAGHARHLHVGDDCVDLHSLAQHRQALLAVDGGLHLVAGRLEDGALELARGERVLADEHAPSALVLFADDRSDALPCPNPRVPHQIGHVEDGHDLAGAEHGHSGYVVDLLQVATQRLDHDLLLADEPVHDEAHALPGEADRHDRDLRGLVIGFGEGRGCSRAGPPGSCAAAGG